jgi:hypothetical protein
VLQRRQDSGHVQQRDSVTSVGRKRDGLCFGRAGLSRSGRRECLSTLSVPIDKHLTLAKACRARAFPSNTLSLQLTLQIELGRTWDLLSRYTCLLVAFFDIRVCPVDCELHVIRSRLIVPALSLLPRVCKRPVSIPT